MAANLTGMMDWLCGDNPARNWEAGLRKMAAAFQALGAGVVLPRGRCSASLVWWKSEREQDSAAPWRDPGLIDALRQTPLALATRKGDRCWLLADVTAAGPPVVVWVAAEPERTFLAGDKAALAADGGLLLRGLERSTTRLPWTQALLRARLEEELDQAAHLTAKIAHDFGNILTSTLGFTELAMAQTPPGTMGRQFVGEALDAAKQGAAWVHKLQVFSRRDNRRGESCSVAEEVQREEARLRDEEQAQLELNVPASLPLVQMDAAGLQMVLREFLINAHEASEEQSPIRLEARPANLSAVECAEFIGQPAPGAFVELRISNAGSLLPPAAERGRLPEVLIQTRRRCRGLGLLVAYGVLRSFGGGFLLTTRPESGALARILLPALRPDKEKSA